MSEICHSTFPEDGPSPVTGSGEPHWRTQSRSSYRLAIRDDDSIKASKIEEKEKTKEKGRGNSYVLCRSVLAVGSLLP